MSVDMLSALGGTAQAGSQRSGSKPDGAHSAEAGASFSEIMKQQDRADDNGASSMAPVTEARVAAVDETQSADKVRQDQPAAQSSRNSSADDSQEPAKAAAQEAETASSDKAKGKRRSATETPEMDATQQLAASVVIPVSVPAPAPANTDVPTVAQSDAGGAVLPAVGITPQAAVAANASFDRQSGGEVIASPAPATDPATPVVASANQDNAATAQPTRPGEATALLSMLKAKGIDLTAVTDEGDAAALLHQAQAGANGNPQTSTLAIAAAQSMEAPTTAAQAVASSVPQPTAPSPVPAPVAPQAQTAQGDEAGQSGVQITLSAAAIEAAAQIQGDEGAVSADKAVVQQVAAPTGAAVARRTRMPGENAAVQSRTVVADASEQKTAGVSPSHDAIVPASLSTPTASGTGTPLVGAIFASASPDIGAALDRQIVDMGVSGQWIEDVAQQISSIAQNPGQGSFRLSSEQMGTIHVAIAPGAQGTDIRLTVDNEAAQTALAKDQARLIEDAHLVAVRIGEVRIDRVAASSDSQRSSNENNGQNSSAQPQNQSGSQAGTSQNGGQNGQQADRSAMMNMNMGNNGGNTKTPFTKAVISDAVVADTALTARNGRGDTARYA